MNDIYENYSVVPKESKVVIWGLNSESFGIFAEIINRRMPVVCFVDSTNNFLGYGNELFGKPIIGREALKNISKTEDVFILAGRNNVNSEETRWIETYFRNKYYLSVASDIDPIIRKSENLYIYGAGDSGKRTYKILSNCGIVINAFVDSDSKKWGKRFEGLSGDAMIYGPDIIEKHDKVVVSTRYYHDIKKALLKSGIPEENIYVDIRNSWEYSRKPLVYEDREYLWFEYAKCRSVRGISWRDFLSILLTDVCDKDVILYGMNGYTSQFISLFRALGIEVAYCVDDIDDCQDTIEEYGKGVPNRDVCVLGSEDTSDKMIFVIKVEEKDDRIEDIDYTKLEKIGKVFFKEFRLCYDIFYQYAFRNRKIEGCLGYQKDILLRNTHVYKGTSKKYPGYAVLGNEELAKLRILILGGSTSDVGLYEHYIKSWPEYLVDILENVVIFCGAMAGYNSKQELLKLLRDGRQLKPDLVISYSGVNDMGQEHTEGYPYAGKQLDEELLKYESWGVKANRSLSEEWVESENMMKVIAKSYGADFFGFFQPIIINKAESSFTFEERVLRELVKLRWTDLEAYKLYQEGVIREIADIPYIYDFTNVLYENKSNIFRDVAHVTEEGNRLLANAICEIIMHSEVMRLK